MHNLIIAGIGGQGINRLAHIIGLTCHAVGKSCQFTVHKGGAQSLGSVYAELRVANGMLPVLGPGIPNGRLDSLVALDSWEGLRHINKANSNSKAWVETASLPMFVERKHIDAIYVENTDPLKLLSRLPLRVTLQAYRNKALECCGTAKMANYFAGLDCLDALGVTTITTYQQIFFDAIPAAAQHKRSVSQ